MRAPADQRNEIRYSHIFLAVRANHFAQKTAAYRQTALSHRHMPHETDVQNVVPQKRNGARQMSNSELEIG